MKKLSAVAGALVVSLIGLSGCGAGTDPMAEGGSDSKEIVVGSANFPESELLGEIYAGALSAKDVQATTKPGIGAREAYLGGLKDGSIDAVPEYTGNLLQFYDSEATAAEPDEVYAELEKALPSNLRVLDKAAAENKDSVAVTKETAAKYKLSKIEDLKPYAKDLVLGGPSEWQRRPTGVPGLKKLYGLEFKRYRQLQDTQPAQWLKNGEVQAANIFTTDPALEENGFVPLVDTKNLFPAQNVLPLLRKDKVTDEVRSALDAVSAKLDTKQLAGMMSQVVTDKREPAAVAKEWLSDNGLD